MPKMHFLPYTVTMTVFYCFMPILHLVQCSKQSNHAKNALFSGQSGTKVKSYHSLAIPRLLHLLCVPCFCLSLDGLTETVHNDMLFLTIDSHKKITLAMNILVRKIFFSFLFTYRQASRVKSGRWWKLQG